jgi:serine/threonine-protein kinase
LLHRDVKPANVLVRKDGVVKLADFGLAHTQQGQSAAEMNLVFGTPAFMAPEAITAPATVDVGADMYSFGCTLFFALTGHAPFERQSPNDTLRAQIHDPAPTVASLRPDASVELSALVDQLLHKSRAGRFGSWSDVLTALGRASATQAPVVASPPSPSKGFSTLARKMSELLRKGNT